MHKSVHMQMLRFGSLSLNQFSFLLTAIQVIQYFFPPLQNTGTFEAHSSVITRTWFADFLQSPKIWVRNRIFQALQ